MISSKDARARRDAAAADELCCIFSNEWVEEFKVVLFYKYVHVQRVRVRVPKSRACRSARVSMKRKERQGADFEKPGQLIPLGVYLEELFRAAGKRWPPQPRADSSGNGSAAVDDAIPVGGSYLALTSTHGDDNTMALFNEPFFSIPLPDGGTCVADYGNHRLCVLPADGGDILPIGERGRRQGAFTHPLGLALSSSGYLLVADGGDRVQIVDSDGRVSQFLPVAVESAPPPPPPPPTPPLERWLPHGGAAAVGATTVAVMQPGELSTRNPCAAASATGTEAASRVAARTAELRHPYGVATGPGGRVYVSDKGRHRISCYDASGVFRFSFGGFGDGPGHLHDPRGLCCGFGRVFVADMCNHRIAVFSLRGRPLSPIGRYGDRPGEMRHPVGVALSSDLLLVSEYSGGRLQVLSLTTGECLQSVRAPFGGYCLGALGADARRVTVTDSANRLHCLRLLRRGAKPLADPPLAPVEEPAETGAPAVHGAAVSDPLALEAARDLAAEEAARISELRRTRAGRIELALRASDYRGVLESLTRDDLAVLVPAAQAHAAKHPELYNLPPVRSAEELAAELEEEWGGGRKAPPLGPPH